jgi:hypothetical protein
LFATPVLLFVIPEGNLLFARRSGVYTITQNALNCHSERSEESSHFARRATTLPHSNNSSPSKNFRAKSLRRRIYIYWAPARLAADLQRTRAQSLIIHMARVISRCAHEHWKEPHAD